VLMHIPPDADELLEEAVSLQPNSIIGTGTTSARLARVVLTTGEEQYEDTGEKY
jgi:hypothetical protein